jgi:isoquinoline 1-oxidoreductase subunit alpha
MPVKFFVNGAPAEFDGPEEVPLLWVVREHLLLTGSKFGCGIGVCGACTMHLDGTAVRTCVMPVVMAQGRQVATIEGLSRDGDHPVQKAWTELDVPQCGYCQSGMIMAAADLLRRQPAPSDGEIDRAMTNLCRCATYARIRSAIHLAAKLR